MKIESGIAPTINSVGANTIPAPCPYFGQCGGCTLQHVNEAFYRGWKMEQVKAALTRTGIDVEKFEEPVFLNPATRRRTTLAAVKASGRVILGYNEARSHTIFDMRRCIILEPELDAKVQALRPYLPRLLPDNKTCDITLQYAGGAFDMVLTGPFKFGFEQDVALAELAETLDIARISHRTKDFKTPEVILSRKPVIKKFGRLNVALPPATFLQASYAGEKALSDIVLKYASDSKNIADLFCGCGTFTGLFDANVTAIDGDPQAINALTRATAPFKNMTVKRRELFKNPLKATELNSFDCVIFDPPRAGAKEQALELAKAAVPRVIGISCNPATFARDAKILAQGGYALRSLTLVDQFVWSAHVEVAALFEK
jgi:23S rRNA (uracil1939-C5)-methyltransferase